MLRSALLNVMIAAARKAARSLTRDFGEVEHLQVSLKGPGNFVSAADHRAEKILRQELRQGAAGLRLPRRGGRPPSREPIRPTPGSSIRSTGRRTSCTASRSSAISIGLEREGTMVAGVIYNPIADELFTAEKRKGRIPQRSAACVSPPAGSSPKRCLPAACRTRAAATWRCFARSSRWCRRRWPDFAALVRRRSTSPGSPPAGSTPIGNATFALGYRRRHPAGARGGRICERLDGGDAMFGTGSIVAGNETMHHELLELLKSAVSSCGRQLIRTRLRCNAYSGPDPERQTSGLENAQMAVTSGPVDRHIGGPELCAMATSIAISIRSNFHRPGFSWSGCWCS